MGIIPFILSSPPNPPWPEQIIQSLGTLSILHLMEGPDEVPGVVLPVPGDHTAGGHHPVAHPLQTVEDLE